MVDGLTEERVPVDRHAYGCEFGTRKLGSPQTWSNKMQYDPVENGVAVIDAQCAILNMQLKGVQRNPYRLYARLA